MSRYLADQPMNAPMTGAAYAPRIGEHYGKRPVEDFTKEQACDAPYPPPGYVRAQKADRLEQIGSLMRQTESIRQACVHLNLPLPENKLDDVVKDLMVAWSEQRRELRQIDLE